MTLNRLLLSNAALALLCGLGQPAPAASALAQASASVVEPVPVNAWLGVPVSVESLLLSYYAPAGPATGALVPRVPAPGAPTVLRVPVAWISGVLEARTAFSVDMVAGAGLLARGPAASISAAAAPAGEGDGPLVIIVAFN